MIKADKYYLENLNEIVKNGYSDKNPRPKYKDGTPAYTKFITQVFEKYDISKGEFPITTLRNTATKTGIREILWIYQVQSNSLEVANKMGINWWNEWDIGNGTIGHRYGYVVRKYDLMNNLLKGLKEDPFGRRHYIELLQEQELRSSSGLYPCAHLTEYSVREIDGELYLDMTLTQRSNDYIMAGYINKIQYVALQMMVAGHLGYKVGSFAHLTQNLHIYDRHLDAALEILSNKSKPQPRLILKEHKNFYDYNVDDFIIEGVEDIPKLKSSLEIAI